MSGLHERKAGRKEGSEQKRWKEEAFVRGTEWREGEENGKESGRGQTGRVEWGGRKGNKSADTIAFLDEIQTCNSSKGRKERKERKEKKERSSSSVSRKPPIRRGKGAGMGVGRGGRRDERMVYTKVAESKATCACDGVLKVTVR